ncbi:MAG: DUF6577 family protein [Cryomorphaceae bacterium]|nr:hypothetical protein [Flavobacteriales bacterium]
MHIRELRNSFAQREFISVSDLIDFYRQFDENIKRSTVDWRAYELNRQGILHRIGRGIYSLGETGKSYFVPEIGKPVQRLYHKVLKQFPFGELCIWSTKSLNEFMLHQPGRFYTILDVEKDAAESVFYHLKESGKDVYLHPSEEILSKYAIHKKEPVIITYLTTEAPIQKVDSMKTITLEKVLVDIYCDPVLFSTYQGIEMKHIYRTAFDKYHIRESKMLRYASRRNKKGEIEKLINEIIKKRQ